MKVAESIGKSKDTYYCEWYDEKAKDSGEVSVTAKNKAVAFSKFRDEFDIHISKRVIDAFDYNELGKGNRW